MIVIQNKSEFKRTPFYEQQKLDERVIFTDIFVLISEDADYKLANGICNLIINNHPLSLRANIFKVAFQIDDDTDDKAIN